MIPEISEFSYGFALTNELVGWTALSTAPVFPSLIEEGRRGGGYDVKLDLPGVPLYLQFKRADYMKRRNVVEIRDHGLPLNTPFYRFPITQRSKSFQHTSLIELDAGTNLVFYVAPRFHLVSQIDNAWQARNVASRSIFVAPSTIGLIHDDNSHHVSYDATQTYFCSKPKKITSLSAIELHNKIQERLMMDRRPVRKQLPRWLGSIRDARIRARETQSKLEMQRKASSTKVGQLQAELFDIRKEISIAEPAIRAARTLSHENGMLRAISDAALYGFDTQFFVVQPKQ